MQTQSAVINLDPRRLKPDPLPGNEHLTVVRKTADDYKDFIQKVRLSGLDDLFARLTNTIGKKSFLVFKNNKYINVLTDNIAAFQIRYESSLILCFDKQDLF